MSTTTDAPAPAAATIDAAALRTELAANPDTLLVDVRTPAEYGSGHVRGAVNLPLDQLDAHLHRIVRDAGGRMVLICQSGARAGRAAAALAGAGLTDVAVLAGGMNAWTGAGAPVVRTARPAWALERQVRLVAGSLVAGSVLGSLWAPRLRLLAGAVGAGLVTAALTDTCAMGALLAKLPYNRRGGVDVEAAIARLRDTTTG